MDYLYSVISADKERKATIHQDKEGNFITLRYTEYAEIPGRFVRLPGHVTQPRRLSAEVCADEWVGPLNQYRVLFRLHNGGEDRIYNVRAHGMEHAKERALGMLEGNWHTPSYEIRAGRAAVMISLVELGSE